MKSFLVGLTLATAMALLNGATTPRPSVCVLLPRIDVGAPVSIDDPSCRTACNRAVRALSRLK